MNGGGSAMVGLNRARYKIDERFWKGSIKSLSFLVFMNSGYYDH